MREDAAAVEYLTRSLSSRTRRQPQRTVWQAWRSRGRTSGRRPGPVIDLIRVRATIRRRTEDGNVMKRHAPRARAAALFALMAALLLALLPATGRLLGAPSHAGESAGAAAIAQGVVPGPRHAAHAGLATHPRPQPHPHSGTGHDGSVGAPGLPAAPEDQPGHRGDGDCDYCPLLASLVILPPPQDAAGDGMRRRSRDPRATVSRIARRHPTGLGSRGPPRTA